MNGRERASAIGKKLDTELNGTSGERKVGFVLLVFSFGDKDGECSYVSNGASELDVVLLMKKQVEQFERRHQSS
jgi:hypothetical protein